MMNKRAERTFEVVIGASGRRTWAVGGDAAASGAGERDRQRGHLFLRADSADRE